MSQTARFFPQARTDLIDQATYLAEKASPRVSQRFLTAAKETADSLAAMPTKGRRWTSSRIELKEEIRVWKVQGFPKILIFYRIDPDGISIIRLLHGAQDLPAHLEGFV